MDSAVYVIVIFVILFFCSILWATQSWKGSGEITPEDYE